VPFAFGFGVSFKTSAAISLPALNFTWARAGIGTSISGLFGLRPTRALRIFTSNTPKLRSSTLPPLASASVTYRIKDEWKNIAKTFGYFFFGLGLVLLALIIYAMVSRLVH